MIRRVESPRADLLPAPLPKLNLYEHINFGGWEYAINDSIPALPPPVGSGDGQASSVRIYTNEWVILWENVNYDEGEDQLWIAPAGAGFGWEIDNLHDIRRPHGNNHWGDRIRCVAFPGSGPSGDNDNRTIVHEDGHVTTGNPQRPERPRPDK